MFPNRENTSMDTTDQDQIVVVPLAAPMAEDALTTTCESFNGRSPMGIHVGRTAEGYRLLFGDSIQRCAANGLGAAALDRQTGQMVEDYVDLEVPTSEFHGGQDPVTQMMTQEVSFYRDRHGLGAETPRCKHLHI
jgi:hypothetical protein